MKALLNVQLPLCVYLFQKLMLLKKVVKSTPTHLLEYLCYRLQCIYMMYVVVKVRVGGFEIHNANHGLHTYSL